MRRIAAALAMTLTATTAPAEACRIAVPVSLEDVRRADLVVVGRIVNYRIVPTSTFRTYCFIPSFSC
jgi:hypothetical protein